MGRCVGDQHLESGAVACLHDLRLLNQVVGCSYMLGERGRL